MGFGWCWHENWNGSTNSRDSLESRRIDAGPPHDHKCHDQGAHWDSVPPDLSKADVPQQPTFDWSKAGFGCAWWLHLV